MAESEIEYFKMLVYAKLLPFLQAMSLTFNNGKINFYLAIAIGLQVAFHKCYWELHAI